MAESLLMASMAVGGGFSDKVVAMTSSHFASSERQYRFPLGYGGQRTPTAQWTVTGSGAALVCSSGTGPRIECCTVGTVTDLGIKDAANMGAAMAPAAFSTIKAHMEEIVASAQEQVIGAKLVEDASKAAGKTREEIVEEATSSAVLPSDEDCEKYYNENREAFKEPPQVRASHILVKVDTADETEKAKARAKIDSIRARIVGEINVEQAFADAARENSDCPSGKEGGNLGDFGHGQMVPEFENACDAMEVGAVSEPVQTQFGWHLIKLNSKSDGAVVSFEDAKDQIAAALRNEKQEAAYRSKINQLKILYPVEKA
jgi:hypothetical protein